MVDGFFARLLAVDLSRGTLEVQSLPPDFYREYLGGQGLGVRLLYDRLPREADPLGPDNLLGLFPGLLNGTGVPFSGRFTVVGKSPLTGGWGESNCGGHFGPALRSAGLDGVLISGRSTRPIYLHMTRLAVSSEMPKICGAWTRHRLTNASEGGWGKARGWPASVLLARSSP